MSAWYILSALGLYMLNPADGWYETGAPIVRKATLRLPDGKRLRIVARNLTRQPAAVRSISFNGHVVEGWRISHSELLKGGRLVFDYERWQ